MTLVGAYRHHRCTAIRSLHHGVHEVGAAVHVWVDAYVVWIKVVVHVVEQALNVGGVNVGLLSSAVVELVETQSTASPRQTKSTR